MPHMVIFRTNEGKAGYHPAETLDEAVRFVEHLRNNEQVAESKVYRMHEVPIEFKVMYKVEVSGSAAAATDDSGSADAARGADTGAGAVPPPTNVSASPDGPAPLRAASAPGAAAPAAAAAPTGTGAPSPVAQTGGRFGLFSRT